MVLRGSFFSFFNASESIVFGRVVGKRGRGERKSVIVPVKRFVSVSVCPFDSLPCSHVESCDDVVALLFGEVPRFACSRSGVLLISNLMSESVSKSPLWSTNDFDEWEPDSCGDGFGVFGDFVLVGHGKVTNDRCGKYLSLLGCLDEEAHRHIGLDGTNFSGKGYLRAVRCSCNKPSCPLCYRAWAVRSAKVVEAKLFEASKTRGKVEHIIVSVPVKDYGLDFKVLRAKSCK